MGEGRRLRQEARDWLESSLDTAHGAKQHTGQRRKQYKHTISSFGNEILPVLDGSSESHERRPGAEGGDKGEIWHFFMSSSCQVPRCSAVLQSPRLIPRATGVTGGAGR